MTRDPQTGSGPANTPDPGGLGVYWSCFRCSGSLCAQALITQARTKQAATMSEVEWRGRTVPVKIDKARVFLLGLGDNEAAVAQVRF